MGVLPSALIQAKIKTKIGNAEKRLRFLLAARFSDILE